MKVSIQKQMFETRRTEAIEVLKDVEEAKLIMSLEEFTPRFRELRPESFTANSLKSYFNKYVKNEQAEALSAAILDLGAIYNADNADVDKFEAALNTYAASFDEFDAKDNISKNISKISMSKDIGTVIKASRLYYEINDTPDEIDIVTEVRPVYSEDALEFEGFIVRNVLHIEKTRLFSYEKTEFSLSENQIRELGEMCDRAKVKIQTARDKLQQKVDRGVAIFGGNDE